MNYRQTQAAFRLLYIVRYAGLGIHYCKWHKYYTKSHSKTQMLYQCLVYHAGPSSGREVLASQTLFIAGNCTYTQSFTTVLAGLSFVRTEIVKRDFKLKSRLMETASVASLMTFWSKILGNIKH